MCFSDGTNTLAAAFHPVLPKYVKRGYNHFDSLSSTIKLIILYVIIRASPMLASSMRTPSVCVCMSYIFVLVLLISRLFQNCMCPSTCGFKLGDHYLLKLLTK